MDSTLKDMIKTGLEVIFSNAKEVMPEEAIDNIESLFLTLMEMREGIDNLKAGQSRIEKKIDEAVNTQWAEESSK